MKNTKKKEDLNDSLRIIFKTSLIIFLYLILSKIFAYLYRIIIARHFGPEVYGLLSLALIVVGWFSAISFLGLSDGFLRFSSFYRGKNEIDKIKYIFRLSIKILLFTGIIASILLIILSSFISLNIFHNSNLILFLNWFSLSILLYLFSYFFINVLTSFEKVGWSSFILNVLQNFIPLITLILLVSLGVGKEAIIFSNIFGLACMALIGFLVCKFEIPEIFEKYQLKNNQKNEIKSKLLSYSLLFMLLSFVYSLFYGIDSFMIGYFKGVAEVGFYNSAVPIVALLLFPLGLFISLFFPLITKEYAKKNFKLIEELSKQITKWIFIWNLPILILMILFPGAILNVLFGPEYLTATNALRFLAIGTFFSAVLTIPLNLLFMISKIKLVLLDITLVVGIDILLNILMVPKYGLDGAAFSTMISNILLSLIFLIQAKQNLKILPFRKKMINIALITIIPTFLLFYSRKFVEINLINIIILGALFILIYLLLILITGCLDRNDWMIINSVKGKFIQQKL
ncbi:MAG: flippase [Nanoarchaeota archaeon]|nr:flippase [Nanoarchaeota archaeon]